MRGLDCLRCGHSDACWPLDGLTKYPMWKFCDVSTKTIKVRKVAYLGHELRHERCELLLLIMMGSAVELFHLTENRQEPTKLTANLC
ncbi:jg27041 [Pararge aegeria aegeria]|uniref:Jg27041 protein n=1 Tax=Pararge aegeria aegeria TaxID=348720 RepID=A0A8S4QXA7_9NEOP|nr:jg27041 [Pararge aegeria aegeria]